MYRKSRFLLLLFFISIWSFHFTACSGEDAPNQSPHADECDTTIEDTDTNLPIEDADTDVPTSGDCSDNDVQECNEQTPDTEPEPEPGPEPPQCDEPSVDPERERQRERNRRRCCLRGEPEMSTIVSSMPPGISLSFDDTFIESWYAARDFFEQYDARVTFFITRFFRLTPEHIEMLKELQARGHEIAAHGVNHKNAITFVDEHGLQAYLDAEVHPAIELMTEAGLAPTSWAYPVNESTEEIDTAMLEHFKMLRRGGISPNWNMFDCECAYFRWDGQRSVYGIGIDANGKIPHENIVQGLKYAKQNNAVLLIYAHDIREEVTDSDMAISYDALEKLFESANDLGLTHYTFSELAEAQ